MEVNDNMHGNMGLSMSSTDCATVRVRLIRDGRQVPGRLREIA